MTWIEIINLAAIVVGPIIAVVITRLMDDRSARYARKYQIFGDLIRTRGAKLSAEHVNALNLVEIEFTGSSKVKAAWARYMESLAGDIPSDQGSFNGFMLRRDQLFIKLVQEVANDIGLRKVDMTDMMTSNYYPRGWQTAEDEQRHVRQLLISVLSGTKPLPIKMLDNTRWNGPYPPVLGAPSFPQPTAISLAPQAQLQSSVPNSGA